MQYFTADLHLGHTNILKHRPQFKNIEEMNNTIINNILNLMNKDDVLYVLGDIALKTIEIEKFLDIMIKNNKNVLLLKGNHDSLPYQKYNKYILKDCIYDIKIENQYITLCHFPMLCWEKSHYNSWMLHGHIHNSFVIPIQGKIMNVGVDINNFTPVSFIQIKEFMDKQPNNFDNEILIKRKEN